MPSTTLPRPEPLPQPPAPDPDPHDGAWRALRWLARRAAWERRLVELRGDTD